MSHDLTIDLPRQADPRGDGKRPRSSCDLYAAIGRAVDGTLDAAVASGLMVSLQLDPRLRGLRAARAESVVAAVQAMIRAAGEAGGADMVTVRARARDAEVEIAVAVRVAASPPPVGAIRDAACAARRAGANLSVDVEVDRLVWRLALFAPPASPSVLLVVPDPYRRVELAAALDELGFRSDAAMAQAQVLRRIAAEPYAAAVVDLDLGGETAAMLCELAQSGRWPPPVLAFADAQRALSRAALRQAGFAGVIVRPLIEAQVRAALACAGIQSKRPNS